MNLTVCRICGGVEQLKKILDLDLEMMDKLLVCANIKTYPGDLLPKIICEQCDKNLDFCFRMRKQSDETQTCLKSKIKRNHFAGLQESHKIVKFSPEKTFIVSRGQTHDNLNQYARKSMGKIPVMPEDGIGHTNDTVRSRENVFDSKTKAVTIKDPHVTPQKLRTKNIGEYLKYDENDHFFFQSQIPNEEIDEWEQQVLTAEVIDDYRECNDETSSTQSDLTFTTIENDAIEYSITPKYCSIDLLSSSSSGTTTRYFLETNPIKTTYNDVNVLTCGTCHEVFTKRKDYSLHIKQHGKERYQCIQCCKFFSTRFLLKRHENVHKDMLSYQCSYCERSYVTLFNLNRHIRSAHLDRKCWECKVCKVSFSRIDVFKRHTQLHSKEKKFNCLLCAQSFKTKDYLKAHNRTHHILNTEISKTKTRTKYENTNRNQCGCCGKLFKSSFAYKNHLLIHTNEKPYKCESCNKNFRTAAALKVHQRIHSNYRPYQCDVCLKNFRQNAHLKDHKLLHLENVPQHICPICQASFAKKSNLKVHIRIHDKGKLFKCTECSAEFSNRHLIRRHVSKIHNRSALNVYSNNGIYEEILKSEDNINAAHIDASDDFDYVDKVVVEFCADNQEIHKSH